MGISWTEVTSPTSTANLFSTLHAPLLFPLTYNHSEQHMVLFSSVMVWLSCRCVCMCMSLIRTHPSRIKSHFFRQRLSYTYVGQVWKPHISITFLFIFFFSGMESARERLKLFLPNNTQFLFSRSLRQASYTNSTAFAQWTYLLSGHISTYILKTICAIWIHYVHYTNFKIPTPRTRVHLRELTPAQWSRNSFPFV
jgi:hypothetical protein